MKIPHLNKWLGISLILLMSAGCSYDTYMVQSDSQMFPPVQASQVRVFAADHIPGKYHVIGTVSVNDPQDDTTKALENLKTKAAAMGANAVIHTRMGLMTSWGGRIELMGIAVRTD